MRANDEPSTGNTSFITRICNLIIKKKQVSFRDQAAIANRWWASFQQTKNFNNAEAARGNVALNTFYGLGGCLAVAAQNGARAQQTTDSAGNPTGYVGTDSWDWDGVKVNSLI